MNIILNNNKDTKNLVFLVKKDTDLAQIGLSEQEINFVKVEIKNEKKNILLNQYTKQINIVLIPDEKDEYKQWEGLRKSAFETCQKFNALKQETVFIDDVDNNADRIIAFAEGLALSNYQFIKYFSDKDKKAHSLSTIVLDQSCVSKDQLLKLQAIVEAVSIARTFVNEPLSYLTATQFSEDMARFAKEVGLGIETYNKAKIESLEMGGLLAVNKGSIDPPTFNILTWKPENAKNDKAYALVGKGIVYDTGGLSLKPTADSMDYMKSDMGGAAAVYGAMYAIAKAKLPIHVVAYIPATDNRPSGNAYAPGDVITMYNKSTVEVLNTDAEGRMILADALTFADEHDPELVIDVATLTGAAAMAIGSFGVVGMGNMKPEVMVQLKESGNNVYERIAEMPFWDEYTELMKSEIADQKNIGGRIAGAITAGKFLEKFLKAPYIHLDIAGPAFSHKQDNYKGNGGSGVGVRLLLDFFANLSK